MPLTNIDERLFAHINTDPFLVGSFELQGISFSRTIAYLNQFFELYSPSDDEISADVIKLLLVCKELSNYTSQIFALKDSTANLEPIVKEIQTRVGDLSEVDYLLLPGGWISKSDNAHMMIYEFKKDADGSFLFIIHNSGSGLEYHAKRSDKEKELYNSTLTYKIPKEALESDNFISFMKELISLQVPIIHKKPTITAEYVYKTVLAKLSYLQAIVIKPEMSEDNLYTAGQQSGTCAQHSLHMMLKARFSSLDKYRKFIYRFKAYSLDEYINNLRTTGHINQIKYQTQIQKAIRHQLRILNLKSTIVN